MTGSGEPAPARDARLARRRRLLGWSAPVVVVVLLVALKVLTMVATGQQARAGYTAGSITAVEQAGERMGLLNLVERHKAPFALGDAGVLAGDLEAARAQFERALALAPGDGLEACQVRVNLVLALEGLAEAASAAGDGSAATAHDDRVVAVVDGAPAGCFQPGGQGTGQQLDDARSRARQRSDAAQPGQDPQAPGTDGTPGAGGSGGSSKEQQLDAKTKDNQEQRAQGDQGDQPGGGSRPQVARPW